MSFHFVFICLSSFCVNSCFLRKKTLETIFRTRLITPLFSRKILSLTSLYHYCLDRMVKADNLGPRGPGFNSCKSEINVFRILDGCHD